MQRCVTIGKETCLDDQLLFLNCMGTAKEYSDIPLIQSSCKQALGCNSGYCYNYFFTTAGTGTSDCTYLSRLLSGVPSMSLTNPLQDRKMIFDQKICNFVAVTKLYICWRFSENQKSDMWERVYQRLRVPEKRHISGLDLKTDHSASVRRVGIV